MTVYISNSAHFKEVLSRVPSVKHLLWIGTADIKDLYVEVVKEKKPFLTLIALYQEWCGGKAHSCKRTRSKLS